MRACAARLPSSSFVACAQPPQELLSNSYIVEAKKFSKFGHAVALLYPTHVRRTPHWFVEDTLAPSPATGGQAVTVYRPATLDEARAAIEEGPEVSAPVSVSLSLRRALR